MLDKTFTITTKQIMVFLLIVSLGFNAFFAVRYFNQKAKLVTQQQELITKQQELTNLQNGVTSFATEIGRAEKIAEVKAIINRYFPTPPGAPDVNVNQ